MDGPSSYSSEKPGVPTEITETPSCYTNPLTFVVIILSCFVLLAGFSAACLFTPADCLFIFCHPYQTLQTKTTQRCEYALVPTKASRREPVEIFISLREKTTSELVVSGWMDFVLVG